jgi:hypothetical protein
MEALQDTGDFVVVNSQLHDEFDKFKQENIERQYSYLKVNKLLNFYLHHNYKLKDCLVAMYNNDYLKLNQDGVDDLCKWVYRMKKAFEVEGQNVFQSRKRLHVAWK